MIDDRYMYLELVKRCVTGFIYEDPGYRYRKRLLVPFDASVRAEGRDWPSEAHTMVGLKRLDNVQHCVERVLKEEVAGDLIEAGVWRGGVTIFMRAVLKAHGARDRLVWVADSFEGPPPPDAARYPPDVGDTHHTYRHLAVPLEQVKSNFEKYGLLDGQVRFLKGRFRDTLPAAPVDWLSVIRLDGDLYESTIDGLTYLYPKLSIGGFLIVDDYGAVAACRRAVEDFRKARRIREPIQTVDWTGIYWQKTHER